MNIVDSSDDNGQELQEDILLQKRPFGLCVGQFQVPDNFNEALPEDILQLFEDPIIYPENGSDS